MSEITKVICYHHDSHIPNYNLQEFVNQGYELFDGRQDPFNMFISELSMFRYYYEHQDLIKDYICTSHYRRIFQNIPENLSPEKCYVYEVTEVNDVNAVGHNGPFGIKKYMADTFLNMPELYETFEEYCNIKYGRDNKFLNIEKRLQQTDTDLCFFQRCMFVMSKEKFLELCDYLFGYLDYFEKKFNVEHTFESYFNFFRENYCLRNIGHQFPIGWWQFTPNNVRSLEEVDYLRKVAPGELYCFRLFSYIGEQMTSNFINATFDKKNIILY